MEDYEGPAPEMIPSAWSLSPPALALRSLDNMPLLSSPIAPKPSYPRDPYVT